LGGTCREKAILKGKKGRDKRADLNGFLAKKPKVREKEKAVKG